MDFLVFYKSFNCFAMNGNFVNAITPGDLGVY